jgi:hypothetical protein
VQVPRTVQYNSATSAVETQKIGMRAVIVQTLRNFGSTDTEVSRSEAKNFNIIQTYLPSLAQKNIVKKNSNFKLVLMWI